MRRRRVALGWGPAARVSAALGTVVLVATAALWYAVVGDVCMDFTAAHLRSAIVLIAGGAVLSAGLALMVLLASESQPRSRGLAKLALTCTTLAVLLALTPFGIARP